MTNCAPVPGAHATAAIASGSSRRVNLGFMALACEILCDGSAVDVAYRARDPTRGTCDVVQDAVPTSGIGVGAACLDGAVGGLRVLSVA